MNLVDTLSHVLHKMPMINQELVNDILNTF